MSLAACLPQLNSEWWDSIGRWSQTISAGYVRTFMHRMGRIQSSVADSIKQLGTAPDPREGDMLAELACSMCQQGVLQPEAVKQAPCIACSIFLASFQVPQHNLEFEADEPIPEQLPAAAADISPAAQPFPVPLGVFVISVQRHTTFQRLHFVRKCPLAPGIDFLGVRSAGRFLSGRSCICQAKLRLCSTRASGCESFGKRRSVFELVV